MGRSRSRSRSNSRGRRRSYSRSLSPEDDGYRVHVADLGIDVSKREIEHTFKKYGTMLEVWLARNPPCFAFVKYRHKEDADDAIRDMDGQSLCGGRVRVSHARPRTRGSRRRRGFDPNLRCYQCGERGHFSRDCDEIQRHRRFRISRSRSRSRSRTRSGRSRRESDSKDRKKERRDSNRSSGGHSSSRPSEVKVPEVTNTKSRSRSKTP